MNFEYFCGQYRLGTLHSATSMKPGTVAQVWRLETDKGVFLLRTLTGKEQGELEWDIAQHLIENNFTRFPAIRATAESAPFLEHEGAWYQVQEFCAGAMPDPAVPGTAAAMAHTLRELAQAMPPGLIHGDLGPWNMLQKEDGSLFIIDFGSARAGDPCFDFAACLGGIINHTPKEDCSRVCGEFLRALGAEPNRLMSQLRLWAEEGIARWGGVNEKMTARFHHALTWAEENLYEL